MFENGRLIFGLATGMVAIYWLIALTLRGMGADLPLPSDILPESWRHRLL